MSPLLSRRQFELWRHEVRNNFGMYVLYTALFVVVIFDTIILVYYELVK